MLDESVKIEEGGRYQNTDGTVSTVVDGDGRLVTFLEDDLEYPSYTWDLATFRKYHTARLLDTPAPAPSARPLPGMIPATALPVRLDFILPEDPSNVHSWRLDGAAEHESERVQALRARIAEDLAEGSNDAWERGYDAALNMVLEILDGATS